MRVAAGERQHAAVFSAPLPLFLLGRLRLDDGDLDFPPLSPSPLAGTNGLASLCMKGQFLTILASTLWVEQAWNLRSVLLVFAFTAFLLWMVSSGEFSLVSVRL